MIRLRPAHTDCGVRGMTDWPWEPEDLLELRLDPTGRLCPLFDHTSMETMEDTSEWMGFPVLDNCCEDHIL